MPASIAVSDKMSNVERFFRFHVDHIVARQHGGPTELNNLALACHFCNRRKGPNLSAIDPVTGGVVTLFHPRHHRWDDHFRLDERLVHGITAIGRATVKLLQMNAASRQALRSGVPWGPEES